MGKETESSESGSKSDGDVPLWEALKSRVSDPLLSSFLIALAGIRWHFVYALVVGADSAESRIKAAEELGKLDPPFWYGAVPWAVVIALFYTFVWLRVSERIKTFREDIQTDAANKRTDSKARKLHVAVSSVKGSAAYRALEILLKTERDSARLRSEAVALYLSELVSTMDPHAKPISYCVAESGEPIDRQELPFLAVVGESLTRVIQQDPGNRANLALVVTGYDTHVLYVVAGGIVPWRWGDANRAVFVGGIFVPKPNDTPNPIAYIERFDWSGPSGPPIPMGKFRVG